MDVYRKALKTNPESDEAKMGLGIALVMSETGFKEAVPLLNAGVKTNPSKCAGLARAWHGVPEHRPGLVGEEAVHGILEAEAEGPDSDEIRGRTRRDENSEC